MHIFLTPVILTGILAVKLNANVLGALQNAGGAITSGAKSGVSAIADNKGNIIAAGQQVGQEGKSFFQKIIDWFKSLFTSSAPQPTTTAVPSLVTSAITVSSVFQSIGDFISGRSGHCAESKFPFKFETSDKSTKEVIFVKHEGHHCNLKIGDTEFTMKIKDMTIDPKTEDTQLRDKLRDQFLELAKIKK